MRYNNFWDIVKVLEGKTVTSVNAYDDATGDVDGIVISCTDNTKLVLAVDLDDNEGISAWPFGRYEGDKEDIITPPVPGLVVPGDTKWSTPEEEEEEEEDVPYVAKPNPYAKITTDTLLQLAELHKVSYVPTDNPCVLRMRLIMALRASGHDPRTE